MTKDFSKEERDRIIELVLAHNSIKFEKSEHREIAKAYFRLIHPKVLIRPLIKHQRRMGKTYGQISTYFGISKGTVRYALEA